MDTRMLFNEGELCLEEGDYEKGIAYFSSALKVCDSPGWTGPGRKRIQEPVRRPFSRTASAGGSSAWHDRTQEKAQLFFFRGSAYMMLDRVMEAERDLNTAIALMPYYWPALLERGLCHIEMGEVQMAEADIKMAIHRALKKHHGPTRREIMEDGESRDDMVKALMTGLCGFPALSLSTGEINQVRRLLGKLAAPAGKTAFNPIPETMFHMACLDKNREIHVPLEYNRNIHGPWE